MTLQSDGQLPTPGTVIDYHFSPPFVVVSVFVSLLGDVAFVELLHRQRKCTGWRYWAQLTTTALPLALVGIWCMHFVGNTAIILGDGSPQIQPVYRADLSIASAIIPVVTIVSALWISEKRHRGRKARIASLAAAGIFGGLAIVGMHYTGNLGISNYQTYPDPKTVGGAILIGCVAMTVVVVGVSTLQDSWLSTFKWRFVSAMGIALAVPCLHFEASSKITYIFEEPNSGNTAAQYQNVIVACILTVMTLVTCVVIALYTRREKIQIRNKAEQVTLRCAWFDHHGRVMVTRNGILPCFTITNKDNERGFDDDFNTSHPAFHWLFKVTYNWSSISRLVHGMKKHVEAMNSNQPFTLPPILQQTSWDATAADRQYSVAFRERFCIAASEMAKGLRVSLSELGVLYEGVMSFSTTSRHLPRRRSIFRSSAQMKPVDLEAIQDSFGRGQGLFLTKRVDKQDVPKFQSMDYRFLSLDKVTVPLAAAMQVPLENASAYMNDIREKTEPKRKHPIGVYLGLFALCPEADSKLGPKILVSRRETQKLPNVYLWSHEEHDKFRATLAQWDGMSSSQILSYIKDGRHALDENYVSLCRGLRHAIHDLALLVNEQFFSHATLSTRLVKVSTGSSNPDKAYNSMITFCIIPDIHSSLQYSNDVKLISYNFFRCLQQTWEAPRDPGFVAKVHQEFGMFSNEDEVGSRPETRMSSSTSRISSLLSPSASTKKLLSPKKWGPRTRRSSVSLESLGTFGTSDRGTWRHGSFTTIDEDCASPGSEVSPFKSAPFGGVLVTRHISVESSPRDSTEPISPLSSYVPPSSMHRISEMKSEASVQPVEVRTYVDELCEFTKERWARRGSA